MEYFPQVRAVVERRQACALQKGARRIARCGGCYPAFAGVPLPSIFFVAWVERSETRERRWSRTFVPGFRCAQSRLRNDETDATEDRKTGPTPAPSLDRTGFALDVITFLPARDPIARIINRGRKNARETEVLCRERHPQTS